jgi:hypothetical protein
MADPTERLGTKLTPPADLRLRMFALAQRQPISHVLSALLEQTLPSADELAGQLAARESVPA